MPYPVVCCSCVSLYCYLDSTKYWWNAPRLSNLQSFSDRFESYAMQRTLANNLYAYAFPAAGPERLRVLRAGLGFLITLEEATYRALPAAFPMLSFPCMLRGKGSRRPRYYNDKPNAARYKSNLHLISFFFSM